MSTREDVARLELRIGYTNWRGEYAVRRIRPSTLWFGTTEWHPEAQWFLKARDLDKNKDRDFALKDIGTRPTREDVARLVERLTDHVRQALRDYGIAEEVIANDPEIASSTREAVTAALEATRFSAPTPTLETDPVVGKVDDTVVATIAPVSSAALSAPAEGLETRLREAFQRKRYGGDGPYDPDFDLFDAAADALGVARVVDEERSHFTKRALAAEAALASEKAKREEEHKEAKNWATQQFGNKGSASLLRLALREAYSGLAAKDAALKAMGEALRRATDMLSAVAGDIEDGSSLADLRDKYVIALVNCRDDGREALSHYHKHSE